MRRVPRSDHSECQSATDLINRQLVIYSRKIYHVKTVECISDSSLHLELHSARVSQ